MQKHSSHLKGNKTQLTLETNMSDQSGNIDSSYPEGQVLL